MCRFGSAERLNEGFQGIKQVKPEPKSQAQRQGGVRGTPRTPPCLAFEKPSGDRPVLPRGSAVRVRHDRFGVVIREGVFEHRLDILGRGGTGRGMHPDALVRLETGGRRLQARSGLAERAEQSVEDLCRFDSMMLKLLVHGCIKESQPMGEANLVLHFTRRAVCYVEEVNILGLGRSGATLDNVGGDGYGCPAQLRCESEHFLPRKRPCRFVHGDNQLVCQLKRSKFCVVSNADSLQSAVSGLQPEVFAPDPCETAFQVAAVEELVHDLRDDRAQEPEPPHARSSSRPMAFRSRPTSKSELLSLFDGKAADP